MERPAVCGEMRTRDDTACRANRFMVEYDGESGEEEIWISNRFPRRLVCCPTNAIDARAKLHNAALILAEISLSIP